ncbi:hypothetical protein QVD17_07640 [Tagetes erecta]|uniref:Protein kinase domain-containing protein n=1 Tax=Tagetes erecta TaxID=13708 RepID=A0AAD8LIU6_TARER|nr:hypothetical protein QVD17_07640 [Tagetes erecta]
MEINHICSLIFVIMLIILACFTIRNYAVRSDIDCLRSIKESLEDPENVLSSWDFNNKTEGYVCRFTGVECWHPDESKVLNLRLSDMGLKGPFPTGLKNCTSLVGLDLSRNNLLGHIPSNVTDVLSYITSLDLSYNKLSGPIPSSFGNLRYINVLRLNNNQLTGQIPLELSKLPRIKVFNVANNKLSGQVPVFDSTSVSNESYANNPGLCGAPLSPCENYVDMFFLGFLVGFPISTTFTVLFMLCLLPGPSTLRNMRPYHLMVKKINGMKPKPKPEPHQIRRISQIVITKDNKTEESKKYVRRLNLVELKLATNDFDVKNVIGYGNMGLMYKAMFPNGLMLAVKRLHKFESFENEFLLEIEILGRLRHTNLVPLLCFCFEMKKKYLAYKYMSNGTLYQWLHSKPQVEGMKMGWSLRLRIAVGIARGLAWLHHNNILRVAHLKISSKCILLDDKFEPKISNFGKSNILMNTSGIPSSSHTFVVPHSSRGAYTEDVYSFGVLLLELVSGRERRSVKTDSVSENVCCEEFNMIDECLLGQGFEEEIYEALRVAEKCIQTYQDEATSMLQVYQAIRAIGTSRHEICVDPCIELEVNEGRTRTTRSEKVKIIKGFRFEDEAQISSTTIEHIDSSFNLPVTFNNVQAQIDDHNGDLWVLVQICGGAPNSPLVTTHYHQI